MLDILLEDNHLLVVNKPAGLPTMGVAEGKPSVLAEAKAYLKQKYQKPGNVYLGIVSRLDAPVTGALVIARTSKAASRLSKQFRDGEVDKRYWAIVERPPQPAEGICEDSVRKDERHRRMHICDADHHQAQFARLRYKTLKRLGTRALLEVLLETGRKHQIRLQLSSRDWPIVGDRKYGSSERFSAGIALHSKAVCFLHPVRKTEVTIDAPLPHSWERFKL